MACKHPRSRREVVRAFQGGQILQASRGPWRRTSGFHLRIPRAKMWRPAGLPAPCPPGRESPPSEGPRANLQ